MKRKLPLFVFVLAVAMISIAGCASNGGLRSGGFDWFAKGDFDRAAKTHQFASQETNPEKRIVLFRRAIKEYLDTIAKFPKSKRWCAVAQLRVGHCYVALKEYDAALEAYKTVVERYSEYAWEKVTALKCAADTYAKLKKFDRAKQWYHKCLLAIREESDPKYIAVAEKCRKKIRLMGQYERAQNVVDESP